MQVDEPYGLRNIKALVINAQIDHNDVGALANKPVSEGGKGMDMAIMFFLRADGRWVHVCARQASTAAASPPTAVVVATSSSQLRRRLPFPTAMTVWIGLGPKKHFL